jgi:hypothetical protein
MSHRTMMKRASVFSASILVVAVTATATEVPVFVIAGQSNAVGAGTSYQTLSPSLKAVQPKVLYSGPQESPVGWTALAPPTQVAQMNYPNDPKGGFGPELMIGKTISETLGGQLVAETKYAVDGTNLYQEWNPNAPGSLYYSMLARVRDALQKLPVQKPGITGHVAGFFWMQGESDALAGRTANQYQADLANLIAHIRSDFGDPDLPFVFGRITSLWPNAESIREAQANVAATVPYTYVFNTDALERLPAPNAGHYDNQGMIDLGIGFGNGYLAMTSVPEPGTSGLIQAGVAGLLFDWARRCKGRGDARRRIRAFSVLHEWRNAWMQKR